MAEKKKDKPVKPATLWCVVRGNSFMTFTLSSLERDAKKAWLREFPNQIYHERERKAYGKTWKIVKVIVSLA